MMTPPEMQKEIERLNKIIQALMNRAERVEERKGSEYDLFRTAVLLEEQVRKRTEQLESLLRQNEMVTTALRESEAKFRAIVDQSLIGLSLVSLQSGLFTYVNERFASMLGYSSEQLLGMGPCEITPEEDLEFMQGFIEGGLHDESLPSITHRATVRRSDGAVRNVEVSGSVLRDKGDLMFLSVWTDITERVLAEKNVADLTKRLREEAVHDSLTGLFNRRYLEEALQRELHLAFRKGYSVSVIMADIDFFKRINDVFGHQVGDDVLREFAFLLQQSCRNSDVCCRYGGEEFLIVMRETSLESAGERAEGMRQSVEARPFSEHKQSMTASFGVATFDPRGERQPTPEELILQADRALYTAKAEGRNRVVVTR